MYTPQISGNSYDAPIIAQRPTPPSAHQTPNASISRPTRKSSHLPSNIRPPTREHPAAKSAKSSHRSNNIQPSNQENSPAKTAKSSHQIRFAKQPENAHSKHAVYLNFAARTNPIRRSQAPKHTPFPNSAIQPPPTPPSPSRGGT